MEKIIELKNITKEFKVLNRREGLKGSFMDLFSRDYKIVRAVDNVSLSVKQGEIVGFLGPNGAGKSTTIKMMTGVLEPSSGELIVNNRVPYKNRTLNSQEIGVVFGQRSQLWWSLPLIESFKLLKDIYQIPQKDYDEMFEIYRGLVNFEEILHKPVRQMSLGQRTLSDILAAFLHNPKIVFLDEPTIGLDVAMKSKIRELILELNKRKNTTVILTTHDMGDVDALCERIVIIDKGKMLYDNDIAHLRQFFGTYRTLKVRPKGDIEECVQAFAKVFKDNGLGVTFAKEQDEDVLESVDETAARKLQLAHDDEWISILVNEEEISVLNVLELIQKKHKIKDMELLEISTEDVIKKIYKEGI